jgi:hypothetical protein
LLILLVTVAAFPIRVIVNWIFYRHAVVDWKPKSSSAA